MGNNNNNKGKGKAKKSGAAADNNKKKPAKPFVWTRKRREGNTGAVRRFRQFKKHAMESTVASTSRWLKRHEMANLGQDVLTEAQARLLLKEAWEVMDKVHKLNTLNVREAIDQGLWNDDDDSSAPFVAVLGVAADEALHAFQEPLPLPDDADTAYGLTYEDLVLPPIDVSGVSLTQTQLDASFDDLWMPWEPEHATHTHTHPPTPTLA